MRYHSRNHSRYHKWYRLWNRRRYHVPQPVPHAVPRSAAGTFCGTGCGSTKFRSRYHRKMRRCSGDCQRPEETVTDRERLKMGVTDLNRRSWKGKNSYRLFQRPGETVLFNRYTPTIADKLRRCSGACQRPEETVRDRKRLEMGVTDLDGRSWTGRSSYRLFQRPAETVR